MSDRQVDTDVLEIQKSWNQIENNIKTNVALGDGIASGKESNYQEYFNKGFADGFQSGFAMGKWSGASFVNKVETENKLVERPKTGWCQICEHNDLLNKSLEEVVTRQKQASHKNIQLLNK